MSMSGIPDLSSSLKLSEELTAALAAGRWWAIMEVSCPISQEPEYGYFSGQWGGMQTGETSWPTSLVINDTSKNTESLHSSFSDVTLKTMEQRRQKKTPVPACSKKESLTSSLVISDTSENTGSSHLTFSDVTLMTTEHQKKRRQKKHQGVPVPSNSPQGAPVSSGSPKGPPVPTQSKKRGKLRIPEYLRQHLEKAALALGTSPPGTSRQEPLMPAKPLQGLSVASRSEKVQLGDLTSFPGIRDASKKAESSHSDFSDLALKTREQQRKKRPKDPQGVPVHAGSSHGPPVSAGSAREPALPIASPKEPAVPTGSRQRGKLRIPDHLRQHLKEAALALKTPAVSPKYPPMPAKPLQKVASPSKLLSCSPNRAPTPDKDHEKPKVKIPGPLELPPMPAQSPQQQGTAKLLTASSASVPVSCTQGPFMPSRMPKEVHVPTGCPQQDAKFSASLKQQRQKWRENQHRLRRQPKTLQPPQGAPVTRKRALDNAAPPEKCFAIRDQQLEPTSFKLIENLCSLMIHLSF